MSDNRQTRHRVGDLVFHLDDFGRKGRDGRTIRWGIADDGGIAGYSSVRRVVFEIRRRQAIEASRSPLARELGL